MEVFHRVSHTIILSVSELLNCVLAQLRKCNWAHIARSGMKFNLAGRHFNRCRYVLHFFAKTCKSQFTKCPTIRYTHIRDQAEKTGLICTYEIFILNIPSIITPLLLDSKCLEHSQEMCQFAIYTTEIRYNQFLVAFVGIQPRVFLQGRGSICPLGFDLPLENFSLALHQFKQ